MVLHRLNIGTYTLRVWRVHNNIGDRAVCLRSLSVIAFNLQSLCVRNFSLRPDKVT